MPLRPGLFLLVYWLIVLTSVALAASGGGLGAAGSALSQLGVLLQLLWTWQLLVLVARIDSAHDARRRLRIAAALALTFLAVLTTVLLFRGNAPRPLTFDGGTPWYEWLGMAGATAFLGVMVLAARALFVAEKRLALLTPSAGFTAFLQVFYVGFAAGFVRRRLIKLSEAAAQRGLTAESPATPVPNFP